nr:DnaJ -like protein subfamily B member 5 [Ipomoea batatas]
MEHHTTTSLAEAERLLGIAEKLLRTKDYSDCKDFALLAQETEPLLEGSDQILAIAEVLLASTRKINNHQDRYSILQIGNRTDDTEQIKKQYRRFALLLHPDKNKYMFADAAFGLVDLVPTKKLATKRQPSTVAAARGSEDQGNDVGAGKFQGGLGTDDQIEAVAGEGEVDVDIALDLVERGG